MENYNQSLTKAVFFTNKSIQDSPTIKIQNTPIIWSHLIKYQGVQIDKNLNFAKHINNCINKAKVASFLLYSMLCSKSPLSISTKVNIYKTYFRPIITYACQAWGPNVSKSKIAALEAFQAATIRKITDIPPFVSNHTIRSSNNMASISELISAFTLKLKENIYSS